MIDITSSYYLKPKRIYELTTNLKSHQKPNTFRIDIVVKRNINVEERLILKQKETISNNSNNITCKCLILIRFSSIDCVAFCARCIWKKI